MRGRAPLDAPCLPSWNFACGRAERIERIEHAERAERDWTARRMGSVCGETDWIPLP